MNKRLAILLVLVAVLGLTLAYVSLKPDGTAERPVTPKPVAKPQAFNKQRNSLTDPNSMWVIVNKKRPLQPQNYAPTDLSETGLASRTGGMQVRQIAIAPLQQLFKAAEQNGTPLRLASAYRPYSYQVGLYNGYVRTQGQAVADEQSARPGFSEHQTGLAVDVGTLAGNCEVQTCFADTPAGQWLAANAYQYGFLIRYGNGQTAVTGYTYEPWHLRYVGTALAREIQRNNNTTLEQFFGLDAAPTY